jgi:hypothetical protein
VPKIAMLRSMESFATSCQHVLVAASNLVVDVEACAYDISDQASQIADKIAADATR